MLRTIRWLALTASCAAASLALGAPGAQAQVAVTTLPGSQVTPTTATLHGTIDTGGSASAWQLQYGATTQYGSQTPAQTIPEGVGSVYVVALVTHLSPNTIYHFRLVAAFGVGSVDYLEIGYGTDVTFKTKPTGALLLLRRRLRVSGGAVKVPLKCRSQLACAGQLSIDTKARLATTHKLASIVCATKFFRIHAGKARRVRTKLQPACRSLLRRARHHRIKAQFTSSPRTGQRGVVRTITLSR